MKNCDVYAEDPRDLELLNHGVVSVSDSREEKELRTLQHELQTFVCDGEYEAGLRRILEAFLRNVDAPEQPGVWVSGFFGSGKSHLVKMLRALWVNQELPGGQTARQVADLPTEIMELFKELETEGKRTGGGLHAASGTLGSSGAGDQVRMALASVVFRSMGLPSSYPQARFVMWLKSEGLYEEVRSGVEDKGARWESELSNMYVATPLAESLLDANPSFAGNPAAAREQLREQFPNRDDISNDNLVESLREAVSAGGDEFPLTLIVLDEVQQFIGQEPDRTYQVQEVVETCSKRFAGRLMFVGTGQSAIAGTPSLQRLKGRFTVTVQLSDTDVERVIREVVLDKKPSARPKIEEVLEKYSGEISKHLTDTKIGPRAEDGDVMVDDYPLLPVRRRFWERCLRAVDPTGTKAQLRSQLSIVHEAARATAEKELGCVVPADFIYEEIAVDMLETGELPKEVHERIEELNGDGTSRAIEARLAALVFLINKLPREEGSDLGVRATQETLAHLLVEDLRKGSGELESKIPAILEDLVEDGLLLRVDDEYKVQTREGAAWQQEFKTHYSRLQNDTQLIASERIELLREEWKSRVGKVRIAHGESKEQRKPELCTADELPEDADRKIYVWARDGWNVKEESHKTEARQAGSDAPTLFAFVPRTAADDLRDGLLTWKAAEQTLNAKGIPESEEGTIARKAMETRREDASRKVNRALDEIYRHARVYLGGGEEVEGVDLVSKLERGMKSVLARLYPNFDEADHAKWSQVIRRAKDGAPDPLDPVGHKGNTDDHEVCSRVKDFVGGGQSGSEIRRRFSNPPYGWPRDAIDGAIFALLTTDHMVAEDEDGRSVAPGDLGRNQLSKVRFRVQSVTVTVQEKIDVRGILGQLDLEYEKGQEVSAAPKVVPALEELAERAGGDPPLPEQPDLSDLNELEHLHGPELAVELADRKDDLADRISAWKEQADLIEERWPRWEQLQEMIKHLREVEIPDDLEEEYEAVRDQRLLTQQPDPLANQLAPRVKQRLRNQLEKAVDRYAERREAGLQELQAEEAWSELSEDEKKKLLRRHDISEAPDLDAGSTAELLALLSDRSIQGWHERTDALSERFSRLRLALAQEDEPEATQVSLPGRTLHDKDEVKAWVDEVRERLEEAVQKGPIIVS